MKKGLLTIASICVAACCLGGCSTPDKNPVDEYDFLNKMLDLNYSQLEITVTETIDESTSLNSEYLITYSESVIKVEYSVEKFVEISLDDPATESKTTLTGTAIIVDGFLSVIGSDVGITKDIAKVSLNFKKKYFENDLLNSSDFEADVKDVKGFLGSKITCSDMKVTANFSGAFSQIDITYISNLGNAVEYKYNFKI